MSPWATKRLAEFGGDISQFRVVKLYPSILNQIGVAKTEPGDENNQDISALVRSISANWKSSHKTTPTPTATRAPCAGPTRA